MSDTPVSIPQAAVPAPDPVWADWVTVWQSELAALATDREVHEAVQRAVDLWAAAALAVGRDTAGRAGAVAPPRPAPTAAAPHGDAAASDDRSDTGGDDRSDGAPSPPRGD